MEYKRIFSILIFARMFSVFEWVPAQTARRAAGFKHALWCFLLGWRSIPGFFGTAGALINNLMGGVDLTRISTTPPPLPGRPFDSAAIRKLEGAQRRQGYAFLIFLMILFLIVLVVVWPYIKQL